MSLQALDNSKSHHDLPHQNPQIHDRLKNILNRLELPVDTFIHGKLDVYCPIDGSLLGRINISSQNRLSNSLAAAELVFKQ